MKTVEEYANAIQADLCGGDEHRNLVTHVFHIQSDTQQSLLNKILICFDNVQKDWQEVGAHDKVAATIYLRSVIKQFQA